MKYRQFIEDNFLIDEPKTGQLVPFKFNPVQVMYYEELVALGIEKKGVELALREFIVKARREGFSSLILALFAADDITQTNPTESNVVSYKDDATNTFRKRYRRYILSFYALNAGMTVQDIQRDIGILEKYSKAAFSIDSTDLELRENKAHFYCGSASARTGGRGGVLQKLLFSEAAHYPDTENMTAAEIVEGTSRQVDKGSGWIFQESTGNGKGNHFYATYEAIKRGLSRYLLRFYGWRAFYTQEDFDTQIKPEFTDPDMLRQEYPETEDEAFLSSSLQFTTREELMALVGIEVSKKIEYFVELQGVNYIDQCEIIKDFLVSIVQANPNRNFYVGIDSAKDVDKTVITVIKEKELVANGGIRILAIDSTGAGDFMPDWFELNSKWPLHRVKFSRMSKNIMYKNLRVVIQDKCTELPEFMIGKEFISDEWDHFYKEMLDLQKQIIGELLIVAHPKGNYHDDYPDSWCLAEWGYIVVNGVPRGQRPPTETNNFNSSVRRLLDGGRNRSQNGGGEDYV